MYFVDKQDGLGVFAQLLDDRFQTLFEIAPIFGASEQSAHVERVYVGFGKNFRDAAFDNPAGKPFCNGSFADASFANE